MFLFFSKEINQINMIKSSQLCFSVLLFLLSLATVPFLKTFMQDSFEFESSVWCLKGLNESNLCRFKNICYDSEFQTFLFFLSKESVIKGFNDYNELQKIQLSSVLHHNQFYANISIIDTKKHKLTKQTKILSKALLLARFKPNNIMHSIHDDLFPTFLTLEFACAGDLNCMKSYDVVFHDNYFDGPFFDLYKLFSKDSPIVLSKLRSGSNFMLCFKEMLTGLVLNSVVYQYGFNRHHGPVKAPQLTQNDISRFTSFIKWKLQLTDDVDKPYNLLLFGRQKNRKILNINEVKHMIEYMYQKLNKSVNVNVVLMDLFSNDLKNLLTMVSQANGLIGMHGAELILSLFLKPESYVFELFPFGIMPEVVSFVKPLSEIEGSNLIYFSWRNMLKNNSVTHPDAHPSFGGISHLAEETQVKIKNSLEVPAVECCNNPLFLYHMYQDTYISGQFGSFLYDSLLKTLTHSRKSGDITNKWFYPHVVSNISCNFQLERSTLHISWQPPFNVGNNRVEYSLYVKDNKGLLQKEVSTDRTMLLVEVPVGGGPKFQVWISVYLTSNKFKGPDLYINCN